MFPKRVNLVSELRKIKGPSEAQVLEQVREFLQLSPESVAQTDVRLRQSFEEEAPNYLDLNLLDTNKIFHRDQIKKLCTQYRLRFLKSSYYKESFPAEAISAVQELERLHQVDLRDFRMVAPASYFRLENADDPMLFVPLGNRYFYLVHQWGRDLHPLRKMMVWPLKNIENLVLFSFFFSFLAAFGVRELFFSAYQSTSEFLVIFLYTFKSLIGLIFFYGISLGKNFSSSNWNSKFFNA